MYVRVECNAFSFFVFFLNSINVACIRRYWTLCLTPSLPFYSITWRFQPRIKQNQHFNVLSISVLSRWPLNNMHTEYVKATKTMSIGIYGWRKRCLYCLLIILTLVVFINLCLTFWLSLALGLHWVCLSWLDVLWIENDCFREVLDRYRFLKIMLYFDHQWYWEMGWLLVKFLVVIRYDRLKRLVCERLFSAEYSH